MAAKTLLTVLFVVVSALLLTQGVEGKLSHGHKTGYEFVYLDKFCFYGNHTYLNFTITSANTTGLYLLLVDDQDGNWSSIYKHHLTCDERKEKSHLIEIESGVSRQIPFHVCILRKRYHLYMLLILFIVNIFNKYTTILKINKPTKIIFECVNVVTRMYNVLISGTLQLCNADRKLILGINSLSFKSLQASGSDNSLMMNKVSPFLHPYFFFLSISFFL